MLIAQRGSMSAGRLPYNEEVEYVHIPSGAWFDTGYSGIRSTTGGFRGVLRITAWSDDSYDSYWGTVVLGGSEAFCFRRYDRSQEVYAMLDHPQFGRFGVAPDTWLEVEMNAGVFDRRMYADGVLRAEVQTWGHYLYPASVYVGALSYAGHNEVVKPQSEFDLKSFSLYDNSLARPLVRDFIPVRIGTEAAFYDRVTGEVGTSIGTAPLQLPAEGGV